jgi:hypothetical protein
LVGVFFCLHTDKNIAVLSQLGFFALILSNIWQFCPSVLLTLGQYTYLDSSIIYLLPGIVHFISGVTHMENDLLFCSVLKLMFTNGKIIVYKFMTQFYSYLYFCQSYS